MAIGIYNKGKPPFPIKGNGFLAVLPPPLPASLSLSSSSSSTFPRSSAVITSVTGCSVLANTSAGAIPGSHTLSTCDASTARSTPPTIGTVPELLPPPPPPVTNATRAPTKLETTTPPVTSTNACTTRSRRLSLPTSAKLIPSRCSNAIVFGSNVYPKNPSGTAAKIPSKIIGRINVRNPRNPGRSNPLEIRTSASDSSARASE
mmetsp:Transcript_537/g.532  ORF Transcript_537/g.532 Transcript_537/m.532 type:complete len:204 (+) Transcript_537:407-1018(+)